METQNDILLGDILLAIAEPLNLSEGIGIDSEILIVQASSSDLKLDFSGLIVQAPLSPEMDLQGDDDSHIKIMSDEKLPEKDDSHIKIMSDEKLPEKVEPLNLYEGIESVIVETSSDEVILDIPGLVVQAPPSQETDLDLSILLGEAPPSQRGDSGNDTLTGEFLNVANSLSQPQSSGIDLSWLVEGVHLIGTGARDVLVGATNADTLEGRGGNDYLDGQGDNDRLYGEAGDDTLKGVGGNDYLDGGSGNDYLEGGGGNDNLKGGSGNDNLKGNGGNDTLDGETGNDNLRGGSGNDLYIVDSLEDRITEDFNEGIDTVNALISGYILPPNVENLQSDHTEGDFYAAGNQLNNILQGSRAYLLTPQGGFAANNIFYGHGGNDNLYGYGGDDYLDGGTGNDVMVGGTGNDKYVVDSVGDVVSETNESAIFDHDYYPELIVFPSGVDTVYSFVNYTLPDYVENLELWGNSEIGKGNNLNNHIVGNSANNILDGSGGDDVMKGGYGNDTYVVDSTGDTIVEYDVGGFDRVISTVSYTLGNHLENLELNSMSAAIAGTGNSLDNMIFGSGSNNSINGLAGNDSLYGWGGDDSLNGGDGNDILEGCDNPTFAEKDTLTGGGGSDTFVLGTSHWGIVYTGAGFATITDFKWWEGDTIQVVGRNSDYWLDTTQNFSGTSALDTAIYRDNYLIAVVQDRTDIIPAYDFSFV
jgi:Ca2+-binding RTX toxin-like protein